VFAKIDISTRALIHTEAQRLGYLKTAAKFSMPLYVVMLISRISHRIGKATREAAALAAGALRDAVEVADGAMNALLSMPGRYRRGEFDKAELPAPSKANRSSIYRAYAFLKSAIIPTSMQTLVGDFTSAVENTFAARKRRSLKFVRQRIRPIPAV
jgi:hypothetical protein